MNIQEKIELIKTAMPETYKAIGDKAHLIGNDAYALVKRGLRGEPNCFWAMERGHVVGTVFYHSPITDYIARNMVEFGCAYVCIFGDAPQATKEGATNGAH